MALEYSLYELTYAGGRKVRKMLTERSARDLGRQTSERGLVSVGAVASKTSSKRAAKTQAADDDGDE